MKFNLLTMLYKNLSYYITHENYNKARNKILLKKMQVLNVRLTGTRNSNKNRHYETQFRHSNCKIQMKVRFVSLLAILVTQLYTSKFFVEKL